MGVGGGQEAAVRLRTGVLGDGGACRRLSPEQTLLENLGVSLLCRTVALGVSFGLVACVLGLVLGLCFADELLVRGEPLTQPCGGSWVSGLRRCKSPPSCLKGSHRVPPTLSPRGVPKQP